MRKGPDPETIPKRDRDVRIPVVLAEDVVAASAIPTPVAVARQCRPLACEYLTS